MKERNKKNSILTDKQRLMVFPFLVLLLLAMVLADNSHLLSRTSGSVIYTYAASLTKGEIGTGYGEPTPGYVPFSQLEPGDIVLGGWPNTAYGKFSHAGLYIGGNKIMEGYVDYGLSVQDLSTYADYSRLCLLKVNASPDIKAKAVEYALDQEKKMFYPLAYKNGDRLWNCSKIIWRAYEVQGIDLDEIGDLWIAPESLIQSRNVTMIYEKGI